MVEDEEEDEDEDNGKEPQTIGQGEMVNASADDADTVVDDQPTALPEQGQEMREHTPWPQPPAPAPRPHTLEPRPRPRTPDTHALSGLEFLGLVRPQEPRPAAPTLREAETAGNISDVDVEQQLLSESAGGDSLPGVHLPDVPLSNVPPSAKNISVRAEWLRQSGRAPSEPSETPRWRITPCPASIPCVALHIALRLLFHRFFLLCRSPILNQRSGDG